MESNQDLEVLIKELRELKGKYIDSSINWYQSHSKRPRILYYFTGFSIAILSVSLPFFTTVKFQGSEIILSIIALLVAALSGINSFSQWDSQWRGYKYAQFSLEALRTAWELKIIQARHSDNFEESKQAVLEATRILIEDSKKLITSETENYFESIRIPQTIQKKNEKMSHE